MKKILLLVLMAFLGFFAYGLYQTSTPEGKEKVKARDAIKYCWDTQGKKSNSSSQGQFIAGVCEKMESDFKDKYRVSP